MLSNPAPHRSYEPGTIIGWDDDMRHIWGLDLLRFVAAALILFFHLRAFGLNERADATAEV